MIELQEGIAQLQSAGRYMLANDLTWGSSGNMSVRLSPDQFLITASGTQLGELGNDDFVQVGPGNQVNAPEGRRASKEMPMHRAIYEQRTEINAVLHGSPFYSTLIACSDIALPYDYFVEDMYYLERVARVGYFQPGTPGLGEAVREKAPLANVLILENHGVLVYDTSVREALMGLHTLEMVCRMVITARSAGISLHNLPPETVDEFLNRTVYRPRREWPK